MSVTDANITKETTDRYLTYALSVVSGRALPDVRDGLKPVQRRILYAMLESLNLRPGSSYRKSAAVVGEVLARFHPHGDTACYEAMVRMAQDFSLRYPLVDGQGNFGSLDGDSAAAYRYTEAKLRDIALDVIGEIREDTVGFRDNFDATTGEPVVLPSRVPNLLINGASGIAVGMATSIPPHNLKDVVKALLELSQDAEVSNAKLASTIKAPDFPTGCMILNTTKELGEMYRTGRGSVRMRGEWEIEETARGKRFIVVKSIPYAINKAQLVEKIANLIIEKKVPQLNDVRDESTDEVRIVLELAPGADPEVAMAYLFKNTNLENAFPVNFTALVPTGTGACRPELLSLKDCLRHFLNFREEVVQKRLLFERKKLEERIHILEGLVIIYDALDEALKIVRKSEGRTDAAEKLMKRFTLTETQSFAVVDMRIYQLSRTNIEDIRKELKEKLARIKEIDSILKSKSKISDIVRKDLEEISEKYGDKRRCKLVKDKEAVEIEFNAEAYVVHEDVYAIVTTDGWVKRVRQSNELSTTRVREGDSILRAHALSTLDSVAFFTNLGSLYVLKVTEFPSSSGYGSPIQKILKFRDEERIMGSFGVKSAAPAAQLELVGGGQDFLKDGDTMVLVSQQGVGFGLTVDGLSGIKRNGKRVIKLRTGDQLAAVAHLGSELAVFTKGGYGLAIKKNEIPIRSDAAVGVSLMGTRSGDVVVAAVGYSGSKSKISLLLAGGSKKELTASEITRGHRGLKGQRAIARGEIVSASLEG